ncbi:unnamed protein product [Parajaminaea phylloscopi]
MSNIKKQTSAPRTPQAPPNGPLSRIAAISRQLAPTSPFSTRAAPEDGPETLGRLKLGPDVDLPVFEPSNVLRLPAQRLLLDLEDPNVLSDLTWMAKKWQLGQDIFLLSPPGPYSRHLALTFSALLQVPFEYVSMHRDIGESELLQQRSLRAGGTLEYVDGPVVRAMKSGSLLIIEGVQRAERNVMPLLNNILENREANLADGTQLVPGDRVEGLRTAAEADGEAASRFIPVHPNFRTIALGLPTPPYTGLSLDPPFRSRFQSRWVESLVPSTGLAKYQVLPAAEEGPDVPRSLSISLAQRLHEFASLVKYHDRFARGADILPETERLPTMPQTTLPLLEDIAQLFPPAEPLAPPSTTKDLEGPPEPTYGPPQDGALQVPDFVRTRVEAGELEMLSRFPEPKPKGLVAQETRDLLGSAWPNLYTIEKPRKKLANDLLEKLGLDYGVGAGVGTMSTSDDGATGLLGYRLREVRRLSEVRALLIFQHAVKDDRRVEIEVACGPLAFRAVPELGKEYAVNNENIFVTPRLLSMLTIMSQLHAAGRDLALLPSAFAADADTIPQSSSSTTTAIGIFGAILGYPVESVWLWKDVGGNELIMRRVTTPEGDTTFEPSPLLKGAMEAKIVHLAGIDVLGPTVGSLSSLLQDRTLELWEGGRATLIENERAKFDGMPTIGPNALLPLHPAFRLIATSSTSKPEWLNEEVSTLFGFVSPSPMSDTEEREIVSRRAGCPPEQLELLFGFAARYRKLSSDPTLGLSKSRRLGTRSLIRIAQRMTAYPQSDLRTLIERSLMVDFLPRTSRDLVRTTLSECGLFARGAEGNFQYRAPEFLADPRTEGDTLIFEDLNAQGKAEAYARFPIFDAVKEGDAEGGHTLIPSTGKFYDNPTQSLLARDLAIDLDLKEHLLLLGNQGTGKNKIIDRLCELLRRPREYIQLSRDSSVNSILQIVQLEGGQLVYLDSPLVRAIKLGRICVVDEADKCSSAVTSIFRSLSERGQLTLPDGRQVRPPGSQGAEEDIIVHPNFRCVLLANRPGFPFLGNEFLSTLGEGFSPFAIANPDLNSEVRLLKQAAPSVSEDLIKRLDLAFHDLRGQFDAGLLNYPYSLRELLHIVRHLDRFPEESLVDVLLNTLSFDLHRPQAMEAVATALKRRGLDVKGLSISEVREKKEEELRKAAVAKGRVDFDPKKHGRDTDLSGPKEGKVDPQNKEHHGGNTWRGGTGGRDTAGLGGRGGFERLASGHEVKQISDELKRDVPEHIKEQARQMAREALAKKLAQEGLTQHEAATYEAYRLELEAPINHLVSVLQDLQANRKERTWLTRQQEGELDERRLTNALSGERSVFRRRQEAPPEVGAPQTKPKRIRFLVDCSASMYSMSYDGRLDREIKSVLMVMEAMSRVDSSKFVYDVVGHNGETDALPLVDAQKPPQNAGKRWKVLRDLTSSTQFTMSGDNTVEGIEAAVKGLAKEDAEGGGSDQGRYDDLLLIALSDANLGRYGITSQKLERALNKSRDKVKGAVIFIGGEMEAQRMAKELPGKAFNCQDLKTLPMLLSEILVGMVGREG